MATVTGANRLGTIRDIQSHARWRWNMLAALVGRDLAARYRGAIFGWLWPILVQLAQLLVFTYLFAAIFHVRAPVGEIPAGPLSYGLWLFSALIAWNALQIGATMAATAIVAQPNLVKKVVFPLALLPLVPVLSALVEAAAGYFALAVLIVITTGHLSPLFFLLPIVLGVQAFLTAGIAYALAAVTVFIRDIPQLLGPTFLLVFYLTPIVYPAAAVPARFQAIANGNPLRVLIDADRSLIFGTGIPFDWSFATVTLIAIVVFLAGWGFFRSVRPVFADVS